MQESQAIDAFSALAQETRLRILRLLVQAGPGGKPAGAVSESLGLTPSNASFHLSFLERAGLIQSRREARRIIYSAAYPALADLVRFLLEDCCGGDAEVANLCGVPVPACKTC